MQSLIDQILAADRLDSIAQAQRAMQDYVSSHAETADRAHPIWGAAGAMKRTEDALLSMEEDGVNLEKFYREREDKFQLLLSTPRISK